MTSTTWEHRLESAQSVEEEALDDGEPEAAALAFRIP